MLTMTSPNENDGIGSLLLHTSNHSPHLFAPHPSVPEGQESTERDHYRDIEFEPVRLCTMDV
jgi:hypothetical protein